MSMAGAMRIRQCKEKSCTDEVAQKPSDAPALPGWLRAAYAETITLARAEIVRQAKRGMAGIGESDAGLIADRRIKAIMEAAGPRMPSEASAAAYRRDHVNMMAGGTTPLEKATTFQHFNRLRTAWKFGEVEAVRALRRAAETARKAGNHAQMRALTVQAFDRAILLDAMFLSPTSAPSRQTWGRKAAALRAAGIGKVSKSKRAAGRAAPTPDQLLMLLSHQRGRCARVELAAAVFACFGVRPAEMLSGVRLFGHGDGVAVDVQGAKVDNHRGQATRQLAIAPERRGCSGLAVALLRDAIATGSGCVRLTAADLAAVRRAMREAQKGLSPYAFRHARASDIKASHGRMAAATWLGHSSDRAQSHYGNARSSSGAVAIVAACGSRAVRRVKSPPMRPAVAIQERAPRAPRSRPSRLRHWLGPR